MNKDCSTFGKLLLIMVMINVIFLSCSLYENPHPSESTPEKGVLDGLTNRAIAQTFSGYVMGYFKQQTNGYGLFLAYSTDGKHWAGLNGGNAVIYPDLGTKGLRDPFMFRKQDGTFGVLGTDMLGTSWGDWSYNIHFWESTDLCSYKNERLLTVHNTSGMHSWAPKAFYDYNKHKYGIIWSGNTDYNRIYVNYTTDFYHLESNQVYFDPGYDVIDASMVQHSGTAYLFFKDERSSGKAIKGAKSSSADPGTFTVYTPDFLTVSGTEGPMPFKDNNQQKWYMYADVFVQSGTFQLLSTTNLNSTLWTNESGYSLPSGVRHGSVVPVTQTELTKIVNYFNG